MLDLRRLIRSRLHQNRPGKCAFSVQANLLGHLGDVVFVPSRHTKKIHSNGTFIFVDIEQEDKVYLTYPHMRGFKKAPAEDALPLKGGGQYIFSGRVDVFAGSRVSAVLMYFDGDRKLGHESTLLTTGGFMIEADVPTTAQKAVLGFRVKGPACFAVHNLALAEVQRVGGADEAKTVMMIVLNDIVHDGRVLKTAQTLMSHGYDVTVLGMWRTQSSTLTATRISGMPTLIFPNPTAFLRKAGVRALNWEHQIAYLRASMWHYVERAGPRFIHTHDYHTVPLGFEFTRRLRALGRRVHWLHDFHEYVPGYDHMEADWQEAILRHEAQAIGLMDYRFTVSPLIAEWLQEQYELDDAPTIVMNAPARSYALSKFERSIRHDLRLAPSAPLIAYTGLATELRGLHTVVEALAADPTWHFTIVTNNTGSYIARLENIAVEGGYRDRLHFLPYVAPHEVSDYVRDASIGIMPLRRYGNADATLSNKMFDYLHASLPMVTSDCTLMKGFVEKWRIGEVFEAENVADCVGAIRRALDNQLVYRERISSYSELLRECTWEEQSKKIIAAYEDLQKATAHQIEKELSVSSVLNHATH